MHKILAIVLATSLALWGCQRKKDEPTKPPVSQSTVEVCLDDTSLIRQEDARCEEGLNTFHWVYITDSAAWPAELPAVGEYIQGGRSTPVLPKDASVGRVPRGGGRFTGP